MASVTKRIDDIQKIPELKQPRGGYIKTSWFDITELEDDNNDVLKGKLFPEENISPNIVGSTVDYLSRFIINTEGKEKIIKGAPSKDMMSVFLDAFKIPVMGIKAMCRLMGMTGKNSNGIPYEDEIIMNFILNITGIDNNSIIHACILSSYDIWVRNPVRAMAAFDSEIKPCECTIKNIKTMVQRSVNFFNQYGPVVSDGFTFEPSGYTETVDSGDGDFLTKDTLWDFKTIKGNLTAKHTLQLAMYWIMGQHSGQEKYKSIDKIGVFNPRQNKVYLMDVNKIPQETIKLIENKIIRYK